MSILLTQNKNNDKIIKKERRSIMHKKYFVLILISHLAMIGSLFAPLIRVSENRLNNTGITLVDTNYVNIIQYVYNDIYTVTAVFMIILSLISIGGAILSVIGITRESLSTKIVKISFGCCFSRAAMGALQMYSKSYVLFLICAVCFFASAICTIRLMRLEKY
jgi:hypothetical protein